MNRNRVLLLFGAAWLAAGLLSWMIYRRATAPSARETVQVVAAARELPVGRRLTAADLKLAEVARKDLPAGYLAKTADGLERAVLFPLGANELVLESKLAPKQGGEGLTAIIEPGKRAVTVQVNETIGVAGFVQPGSKVDVVFTRSLPNGDSAATTILQNVTVLALGRNLQRPSQKPGEGAPAAPVSGPQATVTLLVSPDEAARVALATQRGKIQLALRNPLDSETPDAEVVYAEDLGIAEPERGPRGGVRGSGLGAPPEPLEAPKPPPKPKDPKEGKVVVKVFRGTKVSEDIF